MKKEFEYKNHLGDIKDVVTTLIVGKEDAVTNPLVSVIMPIYNHPIYFRKSLLSVLNQKCDFAYEIVIVDNCHPEFQPKNQKIVEELYCDKIRYYINEVNIGGVGSENRGAQLANGEYISFCHDDDMLYEDALQTLIGTVDNKNKNCAIFGNFYPIDENDNLLKCNNEWHSIILNKKKQYNVSLYDFIFKNYTNGCGSLYKRSSFIEIGGFCNDFVPCPDYALNIYYTMLFGAIAIGKPTMLYRLSMQSDSSKVYEGILRKDMEIKELLIDSSLNCKCFFKWIVFVVMKCDEYHQYNCWSTKKPSKVKYIFYGLVKQIARNAILLLKRF